MKWPEVDKDLRKYYRNVFSTTEGRLVFKDILKTLNVFNPGAVSENQAALRTYGSYLISIVAGTTGDKEHDALIVQNIVNGILEANPGHRPGKEQE